MKQNIQFVAVIFFVVLAFFIMLNDVKNYRSQDTVNLFEINNQSSELASTDLEGEE